MQSIQPEVFHSGHRTIKHNHLFLVSDPAGDIPFHNDTGFGFYYLDTRFLCCYELLLNHTRPVSLLYSTEIGYLSTHVYTNSQFITTTDQDAPYTVLPETIQIKRESILDSSLVERYTLVNYNAETIRVNLSFRMNTDFKDMFEIRRVVEPSEERSIQCVFTEESTDLKFLSFSYQDASGELLETHIQFREFRAKLEDCCFQEVEGCGMVVFQFLLPPLEPITFTVELQPVNPHHMKLNGNGHNKGTINLEEIPLISVNSNQISRKQNFDQAVKTLIDAHYEWNSQTTYFVSDNEEFNEMVERSQKDIHMLSTIMDEETYVAAGIPWYVSLFGRDSIITSRFCLMLNPNIAKSCLQILARYQGNEYNDWRDEEPGKILHELRVGELARARQIPYTPYYGTVDATPLWIILLYEYFLWTGDMQTLTSLWPNAMRAMAWINNNLQNSPSGYLTYASRSSLGSYHQGWKDSFNGVLDEQGHNAVPPIALVEAQGYVYQAKRCMEILSDWVGDRQLKATLRVESTEFKKRFNRDFWSETLGFAPIALDQNHRKLNIISSNPGHCLETGIYTESHAYKVADRLMAPDMFNGWGVRTLSNKTKGYNPMSYHNGSVWPHDNAMVARGFAFLDRADLVEILFTSMYDAARTMFYKRLPELFCGFSREFGNETDPPVRYPVACTPQAWAAASVFSFTQSMLNMRVNAVKKTISIKRPKMPAWMNYLRIKNLRVNDATVDLEFRRTNQIVMVDVLDRRGKLDILIEI